MAPKWSDWKRLRINRRDAIFFTILAVTILLASSTNFFSRTASANDFTFGSEVVTKGTTASQANRNANDGSFETLTEADQHADANFSGTTETVTKGTASGAAFPGAFDTDDASRRAYAEVNNAPANYMLVLRPISDSSVTLSPYPASPTTRYDKIDEATAGGNGDTDYVYPNNVANVDRYGMTQMTDPGGTHTINVRMWAWGDKTSAQACNIQGGLYIGTSNYQAFSVNPANGVYNNYSLGWTTNPAGGAWTYTAVNALKTYLQTSDISPVWHVTQVGIVVWVNYTAQYTADVSVEYTGVVSDGQTVSYMVYCQGYRSGSENFAVYAWDYVAVGWSAAKATIAAASDTDYNFALATNERDGTNNKVKLRILDATATDAIQDTVTLDVLKVNAIKKGYALDVTMTAATVAQYGNVSLRIGGKCSNSENFYVALWNYSTSGWDPTAITVTGSTNTLRSKDIYEITQRSTQEVKIRITDSIAQTADQVQDTLSLDWAAVTLWHVAPTLSNDGSTQNGDGGENTDIYIWATYTDADNEAPEYMRCFLNATGYDMTKNSSGDATYYNGCDYYYHAGLLAPGYYAMQIRAKDANSGEVFLTVDTFVVHGNPTLTNYGVTPATGNNGQSFTFFATYDSPRGDWPTVMDVVIGGTSYAMEKNDSGDYTTPFAYHYDKAMSGGAWSYHFHYEHRFSVLLETTPANLIVNNAPSLSGGAVAPGDPLYVTTLLNATVVFTDVDNDPATDVRFTLIFGGALNESMAEVDPTDTTTSDGKAYYVEFNLAQGLYDWQFWATDGKMGALSAAGDTPMWIQNRAPIISNGPGAHVDQWRNAAWYYDFDATDADGDGINWELSGPAWLTINPTTGYVSGDVMDTPGTYSFTAYANDTSPAYPASDSYAWEIHVTNRAPDITNGPGSHVDEWRNTFWQYSFEATDLDTDSLAWERTGPSWLSVGASSGLLSGTTTDAPGTYDFTVWANDSYGGNDSYAFTLDISNRIPTIGSSGNTTQMEGTYLAYHILANDDDSDVLSYTLSTSAGWASISGAWVNGTASGPGVYDFAIWANDSYGGSDTEQWQLTVESAVENLPPYFTSTPIYIWPNNTGYLYNVNAVDPENQTLYYDLFGDIVDEGFCTINHESGQITGLPHEIGYFSANVSVFDGVNLAWQNWSLQVYTNTPVIDSIAIETWQNGTVYLYEIHAHDPENEVLTWGLEGNCTALLLLDGQVGNMTNLTGPITQMGWWGANVWVFDGFSYRWQNFTLTTLNTKPTFITSPILTGDPGIPYYYQAATWDLNNDTIVYAIAEGPDWMFLNNATGELEGTPTGYGIWDVKLTAFDGMGYSWQNFTTTVAEPYVPPPVLPPPSAPPDMLTTGMIMALCIVPLMIALRFMKQQDSDEKSDKKTRNKK